MGLDHLEGLLLATGNPGKLRELRARLDGAKVEVFGLDDLPSRPEEVPETGATFAANAILKATGYGWIVGAVTLADDSGLEVDALGGAPGVHSARFSDGGDAGNNALLLEKLQGVPDAERTARFRCALALYVPPGQLAVTLTKSALDDDRVKIHLISGSHDHFEPRRDGAVFTVDGAAEGRILHEARGDGGFGYDPLFLSDDLGKTFAEASDDKKAVSHRGRALARLLGWLGL